MPNFIHQLAALCCSLIAQPAPRETGLARDLLEPTTMADWVDASIDGTGCYWSETKGGPIMFVASGEKGIIKMGGRVVVMPPAPDAADLYPFTHDLWSAANLRIRVIDSRMADGFGESTVTTSAVLVIQHEQAVSRLDGFMICGS